MEMLQNLAFGFEHALTIQNLAYCALGCVVGTVIGLLPGLGPLATISLLLPLTYSIPTDSALIMLAGIYYGAQYGDSVSAITMKIPHASSIVACIDGYQMTLKGKTGLALFTAGVSSFIGGTVAIVVLASLAPTLGQVGLLFGPADYCALMLLGFICVSIVTTGSLVSGLAMCLIGVLLGQIGTDVETRHPAFHVQHSCADRRRQPGERRARLLRHCRDRQEPRCARGTHTVQRQDTSDADLARVQAHHSERVARQRGRLAPRHPARRRPDDRAVRCLCGRQEGQQVQRRDRLRRIEGVAGQAAADEAAARTSFIPLMSHRHP